MSRRSKLAKVIGAVVVLCLLLRGVLLSFNLEGVAWRLEDPTSPTVVLNNETTTVSTRIEPVDCSLIPRIEPVNVRLMRSDYPPHYNVSLAWWDFRLQRGNQVVKANPSIKKIQQLLMNSTGALVDVGANVGFMAMFGYSRKDRTVIAVEPISYNIAKVCEGLQASQGGEFILYHAAVGSENGRVEITRPSDKTGYFDTSSIIKETIKKCPCVTEEVPLVTLDSVVPDIPIGVVKIDVQGLEEQVVRGMTQLLSRKTNFPQYVFYEEVGLAEQGGLKRGGSQKVLEEFGYSCQRDGNDILCQKG
jgi:FkbM family methyltransferase